MEPTGFLSRLTSFAIDIDVGRKGLATDGEEHVGRLSYEKGISGALTSFQQAHTSADPQVIILSELVFLQQELQFCHEADTATKSSLTKAIQSFEDSLRCLKIAEDPNAYRSAEATYPTDQKFRVRGYPKDAFHIACDSHRTRLKNVLRAPGIYMIEKAVLEQRIANMAAAQGSYVEKQRRVMSG